MGRYAFKAYADMNVCKICLRHFCADLRLFRDVSIIALIRVLSRKKPPKPSKMVSGNSFFADK